MEKMLICSEDSKVPINSLNHGLLNPFMLLWKTLSNKTATSLFLCQPFIICLQYEVVFKYFYDSAIKCSWTFFVSLEEPNINRQSFNFIRQILVSSYSGVQGLTICNMAISSWIRNNDINVDCGKKIHGPKIHFMNKLSAWSVTDKKKQSLYLCTWASHQSLHCQSDASRYPFNVQDIFNSNTIETGYWNGISTFLQMLAFRSKSCLFDSSSRYWEYVIKPVSIA